MMSSLKVPPLFAP